MLSERIYTTARTMTGLEGTARFEGRSGPTGGAAPPQRFDRLWAHI